MIGRYENGRIGKIWADDHKYYLWLKLEYEWVLGRCSFPVQWSHALGPILEQGGFDRPQISRITQLEAQKRHDVVAFLDFIREIASHHSDLRGCEHLHQGLTSSDLVDTANAIRVWESVGVLAELSADALSGLLQPREPEIKVGLRTHGEPAGEITFTLLRLRWSAALVEALEGVIRAASKLPGKLSGPLGVAVSPEDEFELLQSFGLAPHPSSGQAVERFFYADVLYSLARYCSILERIAIQIRFLIRDRQLQAPDELVTGSSSIPGKRNPITLETISGLARLARSYAQVGLDNIALWDLRDITHSSAERVVLPDTFHVACYATTLLSRWLAPGALLRGGDNG